MTTDAPTPQPTLKVGSLRGKRVLLVNDDSMVLRSLSRTLSRAGASVTAHACPRDALELVKTGPLFDLIVTDYMMPGMTGLALAEAIAQLDSSPPVVMCTGQIGAEEDLAAITPHIGLVLTKPITASELLSQLSTMV